MGVFGMGDDFFFQAEDGIRDIGVTGVQTCALPISKEFPNKNTLKVDNNQIIGIDVNTKNNLFSLSNGYLIKYDKWLMDKYRKYQKYIKIGRASCRERV